MNPNNVQKYLLPFNPTQTKELTEDKGLLLAQES